jgi:translation initiation factor IF-2
MRVYEVAKLLDISNKELINILENGGFTVKSHMSALTQEALDYIDSVFKKTPEKKEEAEKKPVQEPLVVKVPKKEKLIKEVVEEELKIEAPIVSQEFLITSMTVGQAAEKLKIPVSELILVLLKQGIVSSKNQMLSEKIVEQLARQYGFDFQYPVPEKKKEVKVVKGVSKGSQERLPVVVVLGHVDHGKTTLLDFIRKTRVAQKEKGGITQHLGAYEAETPQGNIIFIDTPGHEAFSNIRGRGVRVADLAILVVAADDSVMPQTIEAIESIKKEDIPVVVAVNKIDRVEPSKIEIIKNDLARYGLVAEDWGGETIIVPISAKLGTGIDKLLEMIILQAQVMDLRAEIDIPARGFILESKMEKGLGPVATVICQHGKLRIGDYFAAGGTYGKVTTLIDSFNRRIKEVGPSIPVQVAGFLELPSAGDHFDVISDEMYKKLKSSRDAHSSLHQIVSKASVENKINIIIKTDTTSSKEALLATVDKLFEKKEKKVNIIHAEVGDITEGDVTLAANTDSMIIGLHTKIEPNAVTSAQKNIIQIMLFDIIYKLLEHLEELVKREEPVRMINKKIGEAVVRKVFQVKNVGTIAGSYCKEGRFARNGFVIGWRRKEKIGQGDIESLERDRKAVKEVHTGFEFAFYVKGIDDWQIDDRVECYIKVPAEK